MLITTMIINGFKKEISSKVFGFWGHIHITDTNINRTFEQTPISLDDSYLDEIRDVEWLEYQVPMTFMDEEIEGRYQTKRSLGGVHHIQPFAFVPGIMSTSKEFGAIMLKGVDDEFEWDYLPNFLLEGEVLNFNGDVENGIIVSSYTAKSLELKVGQRIQVSFIQNDDQLKRAFKIKGIYNTGLEEYDKRFAIVDLRKVQDILGWDSNQVTGVEVFLEEIEDLDIINEYIYNDVLPPRMYAETIRTKFPSIFEWLKLQDINENILLWLMILVGVINMITALMILILERTHMIGVLKALGGSDWQIRKVFLYNAMYIVLYGIIFGNIIGLSICWIQDKTHFIKLSEANYYLAYAPVLFNWQAIFFINIICFFVILLFLVIPTYLVTRISPIKTLRFE